MAWYDKIYGSGGVEWDGCCGWFGVDGRMSVVEER